MALEGVFGNMGEKRKKEKGSFCCGMGERTPHTHDMNMEGREEKEQGRGKERKGKMPRLSSLLPRLAYIRYMYVCVCQVSQESKSRFIEGIEGIGQPS